MPAIAALSDLIFLKKMKNYVASAGTKGIDSASRSIAIIGMSGRFPGGANSPELLWETLKSRKDAISEAQGDRWDLGWHNPDVARTERIYTRAGGYLDQIDGFDAEFFGMSPREARQVDPQQRLLLELAWEAHESAGIAPRTLAGSRTGVFIGISNNDYASIRGNCIPDAYSNTGGAFSIAANRISYVLDLHGPSFALDTACSSSLVCVHQACQAIKNGECTSALAGGVNVIADVEPTLGFARASMLSPTGRCKSFDESGDGYVRAEGGALVLLKSLEDAERDGDPILGVIVASGSNSDGRTLGLSMPNGDQQEDLLRQVYEECDVLPEQVFYVEAHGTGTSVGDPIECGALARVLGEPRSDGSVCHIGSVKSNIGHLEPASGIAGLTKLLLALKHREIPANLHFNNPNPNIDFEGGNLSVVADPIALPDSEEPLYFGINSFGFGGTNAHVVLQEYKRPFQVDSKVDAAGLLVLSGNSEAALRELATSYVSLLRSPCADWNSIAAASALCRSPLQYRLVVSADSATEAAQSLEKWLSGDPIAGTALGTANQAMIPTAFVYSGNGPQWWGMGRQLLAENEVFRREVEAVDAIFAPLAGWSIVDEMGLDEADNRISLTEVAQPMLFAVQLGLTTVLRQEGINPVAVLGHSVGEVAAAWASGALSREQATQVIFHRSREQAKTAGSGKMAAIGADEKSVIDAIKQVGGWLELAAINGPDAVTVAGDELSLIQLVEMMTNEGKFARILQLDYPFHTKAMDMIQDGLMSSLATLLPRASDIPFVSTVEAEVLDGCKLDADYWFRNIRSPVLFHEAVSHLLGQHQIGLFIEIGPHPVLKDYVAQTARSANSSAVALQTLRRPGSRGPEDDTDNLATAIASAHAHGASCMQELFSRPTILPELPVYPWQRERYWRGSVALPDAFVKEERIHPLLGSLLPGVNKCWENPISGHHLAYLPDHVVQGAVVFPGAAYLEMALTAAELTLGNGILDVYNLDILRPLVLPNDRDPLVQTTVDALDGKVEISSCNGIGSEDFTSHLHARISKCVARREAPVDVAEIVGRMEESVSSDAHYADATARGLNYGPAFQGIEFVQLAAAKSARREALGRIKLDYLDDAGLDGYRSHPALFDSCLQATIALVAQCDKRDVSTIPVYVDRVRSFAPLTSELLCHVVLKSESMRSCVVDFRIMNPKGEVLMVVDGARCQKANLSGDALSPLISEWWRPDPGGVSTGSLPALPAVASIAADLKSNVNADVRNKSSVAHSIREQLDVLAGQYAVQALDNLRPETVEFDLASLSRHSRIRREHTPLLTSVINTVEQTGKIEKAGKGWTWNSAISVPTPDELWATLFCENPSYQAELLLLAHAGEALTDKLKGNEVSAPSAALLEQFEDTAPYSLDSNRLVSAVVESYVAHWPEERPMRILEVGGGSGGLSSWVLPMLPAEGADYLFTDPSEAAVGRAERRLSAHRFVRFATLEGNLTLEEQGLPSNYFDLVLVSDLNAYGKTAATLLNNLNAGMAPEAVIVVTDPRAGAFSDLVIGPRTHSIASLLSAAGFDQPTEVTDSSLDKADRILIATREGEPPLELSGPSASERYLIVAEKRNEFVVEVEQALTSAGQEVAVCGFGGDCKAEIERLVADVHPDRVVLLGDTRGDRDLFETQMARCLTLVALVEILEAARSEHDVSLTIVSRGAFPDANGNAPMDAAEAAIWGMGRVIGNEHVGLGVRLVDLRADAENIEGAGWLAGELLRRDDETEVQIAHGHRFVNRERLVSLTDEARQSRDRSDAFTLDFIPNAGLDSLHLRELQRVAPGPGDVEIAVKAAGLNFRDVLWCMGMLPEEAVEHGFSGPTIGMECAGVVVRVGSEVSHLKVGDHVSAFASSCFGSHVTTDAGSVEHIPEGMEFSAAATIPTTFLTAWYGLHHLARIEPGETVLIHGAAGGVGLAAVQIAKMKGAIIIGTAGSVQKRRMLERLGVDHVLNSRTLEFADQVMQVSKGIGVDVVLNSLAGEAITKSLECLRPFGRFLEIGKRDLYANSRIGLRPFRNNLSYFGIDADTLLIERPDLARRLFAEVIGHLRSGALKPLPHQVVPVSRAAEAFRAMQQSRHIGKLVVSMELDAPETLPVVHSRSVVRPLNTYLVTGGLGGFGLESARWLADQGATSLALASRSGAKSDEARQAVAELEARGVTVKTFATDVSDAEQVAAMLDTIRVQMLPLTGIIHSAAVIEDAPITSIETEQLSRVLQAKMMGAWHLHNQTLDDPIEMFVLYSSSSAVVGNPGQGAYVAANLYLDALALQRRAMNLPALAIGWGAIMDAGFLTRHETVRDMLKSRTGLDATPAREALLDLGRVSAAGSTRVSVARFDLTRLHQMLPGAQTPRFAPIIPTTSATLSAEETLGDLLESIPASERRAFVVERVKEHAAHVLGTSASQINADAALGDLGLDSLMAVELASIIERDIGQAVPVMQLLSAVSLSAIADYVSLTLGVITEDDAENTQTGDVAKAEETV